MSLIGSHAHAHLHLSGGELRGMVEAIAEFYFARKKTQQPKSTIRQAAEKQYHESQMSVGLISAALTEGQKSELAHALDRYLQISRVSASLTG